MPKFGRKQATIKDGDMQLRGMCRERFLQDVCQHKVSMVFDVVATVSRIVEGGFSVPGTRSVAACSKDRIMINERTATWQKDLYRVFLLTGAS